MKSKLLALCLVVLSSACANMTAAKVTKFDSKQPATSLAKSYISKDNAGDVKDIKKVFISSFNVLFAVKSGASTSAGGGYGQTTENLHVYYHLRGVDDQRMQAVTEKLYAEAKSKLQAAGYEVVDVMSDPTFAKLVATASPSPMEQGGKGTKARVFAPKGMAVWGGAGGIVQSMGSKGILAQSNGETPMQWEAALMSEKQLDAVRFTFAVDFAQVEKTGGTYGARSGSVNANMGLTIPQGGMQFLSHKKVKSSKAPWGRSGFVYSYDEKPGSVWLKQPIVAEGEFVTEVKDATNVGVSVVQGLLGGRTDKAYDVMADANAYENLAVEHGNAMVDMALAERN